MKIFNARIHLKSTVQQNQQNSASGLWISQNLPDNLSVSKFWGFYYHLRSPLSPFKSELLNLATWPAMLPRPHTLASLASSLTRHFLVIGFCMMCYVDGIE